MKSSNPPYKNTSIISNKDELSINEKIELLINYYAKGRNLQINKIANSPEILKQYLNEIAANAWKQAGASNDANTNHNVFIPLNIYSNAGYLASDASYWAGLYISTNYNDKNISVKYINPLGSEINPEIKSLIEEILPGEFKISIEQPLLGKPLQYENHLSKSDLQEHNDISGFILIYAFRQIYDDVEIIKINNLEEAKSLEKFIEKNSEERVQKIIDWSISQKEKGDSNSNNNQLSIKDYSLSEIFGEGIFSDTFSGEDLQNSDQKIAKLMSILSTDLDDTKLLDFTKIHKGKSETIELIKTSYEEAISYFKDSIPDLNNIGIIKQKLIQSLRPVLSKPDQRNLYVEIEDVKNELLGSMYHLGLIYLNTSFVIEKYAKAAGIFQYCAKFSDKYSINLEINSGTESILLTQKDFIEKAHNAEREFLKSISHCEDSIPKIHDSVETSSSYISQLKNIRKYIEKQLTEEGSNLGIDHISEKTDKIEEIYKNSNNFFVNHDGGEHKGLIKQLIEDCIDQLGKPPENCEYSIIGLGSLALGTMTPWSDLEFAILVNDQQHKDYFRNIAQLLHIKIINLQETHLRSIGIEELNNFKTGNQEDDWFWDEVIDVGFNFDGANSQACKLPLGRQGYKDKPDYELIMTPDEMSRLQMEEDKYLQEEYGVNSWFESDKHLVQSLKSVCLIQGSQSLLDEYRQKISEATSQDIQKKRDLSILEENISEFRLNLTEEEEGKLLDVKKDIYRLTDRIIVGLSHYYGISASEGQPVLNAWQALEKMQKSGALSKEAAQDLKEALGIATKLRLDTYSNNLGQKEGMSPYVPAIKHLDQNQKEMILKETFHIEDTDILYHFYYIMTPLQFVVSGLVDIETSFISEKILQSNALLDRNNFLKAKIHARFFEYEKAIEYAKNVEERNLNDIKCLKDLFTLYFNARLADEAEDILNRQFKLLELGKAGESGLSDIYNDFGMLYSIKNDYSKSLEYYKKSLYLSQNDLQTITESVLINLANSFSCNDDYDKALQIFMYLLEKEPYRGDSTCINVGNLLLKLSKYEEATICYKKALSYYIEHHKNSPNNYDICNCYINLGGVYLKMDNHELSEIYSNFALDILLATYKSAFVHPKIAKVYGNLSVIYLAQSKLDKSIKFAQESIKLYEEFYGNNANLDIADICKNLSLIYLVKEDFSKALECSEKALGIYLLVYKQDPYHPEISSSYDSLGQIYKLKGDFISSLECYQKAFNLNKEIYKNYPNHSKIASIHESLGDIYTSLSNYSEALENYSKALAIRELSKNDLGLSHIYNSIGCVYEMMSQYDKALEYYQKSLDIRSNYYGEDIYHHEMISSYLRIGNIHLRDNNYLESIRFYKLALHIAKKVYKTYNHSDIVDCYNNLGIIYHLLKDDDTALKYHKKSFDIIEELYKDIFPYHQQISSHYINKSLLHIRKGLYDQAIEDLEFTIKINLEIYKTDLHHSMSSIYYALSKAYANKNQYEEAISWSEKAQGLLMHIYENNYYITDVITNRAKLCLLYSRAGEYKKSASCCKEFLDIYASEDYSTRPKENDLYYLNLTQLANIALLEGNVSKALEIYNQMHPGVNLDENYFTSINFFVSQENSIEIAYKYNIPNIALNCQKIFLKLDPNLTAGNHFHNLACFYACSGNIKEANEAFLQALNHPNATVTNALRLEYAHFLVMNKKSSEIEHDQSTISNYLYSVIFSHGCDGELQYGKIEKKIVCDVIKNILLKKENTVTVIPKALAFHLLIANPEYISKNDSIEDILEQFCDHCMNIRGEISFIILAETCKALGKDQLAEKYFKDAIVMNNLFKILKEDLDINSEECKINKSDIKEFISSLEVDTIPALMSGNFEGLYNLDSQILNFYSEIFPEQINKIKTLAYNLAISSTIIGNSKITQQLESQYGVTPDEELIEYITGKTDLDFSDYYDID